VPGINAGASTEVGKVKSNAVDGALHGRTAFHSICIGKCAAFPHADQACEIQASSQTSVGNFGKFATGRGQAVVEEC
jgi:hypothetical protein